MQKRVRELKKDEEVVVFYANGTGECKVRKAIEIVRRGFGHLRVTIAGPMISTQVYLDIYNRI